MKKGIHPELYDVVYVDTSSGAQFITTSTIKTDEKMKIDGKDYFVIKVEVSSDTHPFYTGKQKLLDTSGRVDKFMAKMKKAQAIKDQQAKAEAGDDDEEETEETPVVEEAPAKEEVKKEEEKVEEAPAEEEVKNEEEKEEEAPAEEEEPKVEDKKEESAE